MWKLMIHLPYPKSKPRRRLKLKFLLLAMAVLFTLMVHPEEILEQLVLELYYELMMEGLGVAINNAADYRAVILGLKYALEKGFSRIFVQGDSKLVCMQVQGQWQVKHPNIATLYEVKKLKDKFVFFKISHVLRDLNSEADAQANLAITLAGGGTFGTEFAYIRFTRFCKASNPSICTGHVHLQMVKSRRSQGSRLSHITCIAVVTFWVSKI